MTRKIQRFRLELIFAFILVTLGVSIIIAASRYGFGTADQPGPGAYPFFVGLSILITSLIQFFSAMKEPAREALLDRYGGKKFLFMIVTFVLWIIAMPYLGYVIVTLMGAYAFCKIMKLEGWKKPLVLSVGTALLIYLLFDYWMYIDLPRGILG
jgi:putative tricarboxylic transport membrane protein